MTNLDTAPVWAMSGGDILAELDALHAEVSGLETRRLNLLGRLEALGYAKDIGAGDTIQLVSLRHRLDRASVRRDVKLAVALPKYPIVNAALPHTTGTAGNAAERAQDAAATDDAHAGSVAGGSGAPEPVVLHPAQAEAIVSALERIPSTAVRVEDLVTAEAEMVEAARIASPRDLRKLGAQVLNLLDTDGPEPKERTAREKEQLWLSDSERGVRFGGFLSNENADLFRTLIDAAAKPRKTPDGELDPRTRAQRQADALVVILHAAAAAGGGIPAHGGIRPHLAVTISLEDLINAGADATGDTTFGDGLSAAEIRRIACDAGIIPIVLGADSEPLDVGREQRYVTPAIRQALIVRDQGCIIPGCDAPPGHCDAHHLIHWANDGPTSIENCVLACKPHHRAIHRGEWTVTMTNGIVQVDQPPWATPGYIPPPPWACRDGAA